MKTQTTHATRAAKPGRQRILVVANGILEGAALRDVVGYRAESDPPAQVLVIAPALNSRLRHWLSDEDEARRRASLRVDASLERLGAVGIEAEGRVGDPDPLLAIADALHEFEAQEIVIATDREGRSHRLTRDLVGRARRRFGQPVVQVAVEPSENSELASQPATRCQRARSAKGAVACHPQEARA